MLKLTEISQTSVTRFDLTRQLPGGWTYWTTAYRVGSTLIDSGCAHTAPELAIALKDAPLKRIINTHAHEDHIGANARLQRQHAGLEILAHTDALPVLADPRLRQPLHPYRRLFWGWPEASQAQSLVDGDVIESDYYSFQVVHTPGHSPDHICLYEPRQGWLFTGDLFVGGQDRALRAEYDIWQIIASLKRIATLNIETMFPGCARVRHNPAKEIRDKIAFYEMMGERVLEYSRQGRSVGQIARQLFGRPMYLEWVTLGHFSRRCLVRSYLRNNPDRQARQ